MLPILWRASARADLALILRTIAKDNLSAARHMKGLIESAVLPTAEHPYLYRKGKTPATREIVAHPNYIVVYRVTIECIEVVNVVHARREFPSNQP